MGFRAHAMPGAVEAIRVTKPCKLVSREGKDEDSRIRVRPIDGPGGDVVIGGPELVVMGGAVLTMAPLGIAASVIPAWRALAVDPAKLMREE